MIYSLGNKYLNTTQYIEITESDLLSSIVLPVKLNKFLGMAKQYAKEMSAKKTKTKTKSKSKPAKKQDLHFVFKVSDYNKFEPAIINLLDQMKNVKLPHEYNFYVVNEKECNFMKDELNSLSKINNRLHLNKLATNGLLFPAEAKNLKGEKSFDLNNSWDFLSVQNANNTLDNIANDINSKDLSTYERYLAAYAWVTKYKVVLAKSKNISSDFVGVLSGMQSSEEGLSFILKNLCDRINVPCLTHEVMFKDDMGVDFHTRNLVKIKDHKYGINGIYVSDPRIDSKKDTETEIYQKSFFYNLMPANVKFDTSLVATHNPDKIIFDLLQSKGDELNRLIELQTRLHGFSSYDKFEKANFIEQGGSKELNLEKISRFHSQINNTEAVSLDKFKKALALVYSKVELGYHSIHEQLNYGLVNLVENTCAYNYTMYHSLIQNMPHLKDNTTFTNSADYDNYMVKREVESSK